MPDHNATGGGSAQAPAAPTTQRTTTPAPRGFWPKIVHYAKMFIEAAPEDIAINMLMDTFRRTVSLARGPQDWETLGEVVEHLKKGEHAEAAQKLRAHTFGGKHLAKAQHIDEVYHAAIGRFGGSTPDPTFNTAWLDLQAWISLPENARMRGRFNTAILTQPDTAAQVDQLIEFVTMTPAERIARLTATGKLDPNFIEEAAAMLASTTTQVNQGLHELNAWLNTQPQVQRARRLIR